MTDIKSHHAFKEHGGRLALQIVLTQLLCTTPTYKTMVWHTIF